MKNKWLIISIVFVLILILISLFLYNRIYQINLNYIFNKDKVTNLADNSYIKKFIEDPNGYNVKLTGKLDPRVNLDISLNEEDKMVLSNHFQKLKIEPSDDIYYFGYEHKFEFSKGNEKFEFTISFSPDMSITNNFSFQGVDTYKITTYNIEPIKGLYYKYWKDYLPESYKNFYKHD